ncbi:MAG TPA: hypothetical protein VFV75_07830 [Candidatus Polarisedimenticolaceae bacterium]|nr:hypothetical protein [Candidatus Polarisedimenticolaceae bacterium]
MSGRTVTASIHEVHVRGGGVRVGLVLVAFAWGTLAARPASLRVADVARLSDPVLLERICRQDASPSVRAAALARLDDPRLLASLARSHPDWRIRKAAVARVQERAVLTLVAERDGDADVREAARRRLDPAREAAGTPERRMRQLLSDPVLTARFGPLALRTRVSEEAREYARNGERGQVLVERVEVEIRGGGAVLFEKEYQGRKGRRSESFLDSRVKRHAAEVDLVEVAAALLQGSGPGLLRKGARSADKYVRAAAEDLLDGQGTARVSAPVVPTLTPAARDLPDWEPNPFLLEVEAKPREGDLDVDAIDYPVVPRVDPLLAVQQQGEISRTPDGFSALLRDFPGQVSASSPPDATGAVGRHHYVQVVNQSVSTVRVFDKVTGANLKTFTMQSLAAGPPCSSGFCDPVVVYDTVADRWLIAELPSSGGNVCMYVSTSEDPTGTWYAYAFPVESSLPDYPKYGVWPQSGGGSYLMGANAGTSSVRDLFAFDRARMLAGQPATFQKFSVPRLPNLGFQLVLPSSLQGTVPPPEGEPALFVRQRDDEALSGAATAEDFLELWALAVDWTTPANSVLQQLPSLPIADFDLTLCGIGTSWACMPQPDTSQKLDPIREPLHFPVHYRNLGDHQALVGAFPTDVDGTDHAALRWFELRKEGGGSWTVHQEGVIGGESGVHRSVGSIAMDQSGNLAVAYTRTGTSAPYFPSLYYRGRLAGDPPGTMPQGEYVLVDGVTSKTNNERWGDYAGMSVDPEDDCTFWFTSQYGGSGSTRVAAFRFDACGCAAVPAAPAVVASAPSDNRIELSWEDSATPEIVAYRVLRATVSGGPYTEIASVPDVSPGAGGGAPYVFQDDGVSGGITYYYVVRATDGAACTSAGSAEVAARATGRCTLAPAFAGLEAVVNAASETCTLRLTWAPATPACEGPVSYNVYRGDSAAFVPGTGNRIAEGVAEGAYVDSGALQDRVPAYYVVRAVDGASGVEDGNLVRRSAVPSGPVATTALADSFEAGGGFDLPGWTRQTLAGATSWTWSTARAYDGTHSWFAADVAGINDKVLVSPTFGVGPATVLSFRHTYQFEGGLTTCYDGGTLEVSTDGGATWGVIPAADFLAGGYTGVVNPGFSNPIGGKPGWCAGVLGPMIAVTVNLGGDASLVNREVRVRWHEGDDTIVGSGGWYVDAVTVAAAQTAAACAPGPALLAAGEAAQLRADRSGASVALSWDGSCLASDDDYAVYEGTLGAFTSHAPRLCSTGGARTASFDLPAGSVYWLVVPRNGAAEGSYGVDGSGTARPASAAACLPASVGLCP